MKATIDRWSGGAPGPWTRATVKEWFIDGTQPGAKHAIDQPGLLYTRACGGWMVDPSRPSWAGAGSPTSRAGWSAPVAGRVQGPVRLADRLLLRPELMGRLAHWTVPDTEAQAEADRAAVRSAGPWRWTARRWRRWRWRGSRADAEAQAVIP